MNVASGKPRKVFGEGLFVVVYAAYPSEPTVFGWLPSLWTLSQTLLIRVSKLGPLFPSSGEMREEVPGCEKLFPNYRANLETVQRRFNERFRDFHTMQPWVSFFRDPLSDAVSEPPAGLQLDLCGVHQVERNRPTDESSSCRLDAQTRTLAFTVLCKTIIGSRCALNCRSALLLECYITFKVGTFLQIVKNKTFYGTKRNPKHISILYWI